MHVDAYERLWMILTVVMLLVFIGAVSSAVFGAGIQLPGAYGRIPDPARFDQQPPFDRLGVHELGPGRYQVNMVAHIWAFSPNQIKVPVGSHVTFYITSRDVVHGFKVENTDINTMVIPGQVARVSYTFKRPGTYLFLCHEYCGVGHQGMYGQVVVE